MLGRISLGILQLSIIRSNIMQIFPEGKRPKIILARTTDPHTHLIRGDEGRLVAIDDGGTHHIIWDKDGSHLGLIPNEDVFAVVDEDLG
jgi:hypothetical protein